MSIASRITSIENHIEEAYTEISRLGVDLTNVDKNIDNIADKLQEAYSQAPKVIGEGSNLSLTPTREGGLSIIPKGACEQDTLPSEYQAVEYIESTGTQYIDTGFKHNNNTTIEVDTIYSPENGIASVIFGAREVISNLNKNAFFTGKASASGFSYASVYNNSAIATEKTEDFYANRRKYKLDKNISYIDDNVVATFTNETFVSSYNDYIFALNSMNTAILFSKMKLYGCKIYNNNILVRNFIPCYRKSDNVIGLYDLVNNVFYTNQGTGTFAKGNNVSIPNPDYPQDIRVVTGDNQVVVQNKNLFNDTIEQGSIDTTTGQNVIGYYYVRNTNYIKVKPNTNYSIQYNYNYSEITGQIVIYQYDKNKNFIRFDAHSGKTYTRLLSSTAEYIRIRLAAASDHSAQISDFDSIQIEEGSSVKTYIAPQTQTATLNLGTNYLAGIGDYKDEIVGKTDDWKIKRYVAKIEFDGSNDENWVDTVSYERMKIEVSNFKSPAPTILGNILCDKMIAYTRNTVALHDYAISAGNENTSDIWARANSTINTVAKFKTWLLTHNLIVYYALATPTEETITNQTLITDLNNMYQAMGYDGTTNITITSNPNNAQMTASVSALKGE